MKTSDLTDAQLDYWVARAEENNYVFASPKLDPGFDSATDEAYAPSTDWAHGGPLIERYKITLMFHTGDWAASRGVLPIMHGPTPLIAAMRALVASKFGQEVPDVTIQGGQEGNG